MGVLVLNPGSSTLKASVLSAGADADPAGVELEWAAGVEGADLVVADALAQLASDAAAVGYRVVHGGSSYRAAALVDPELVSAVESLEPLAPLHNRRAAAVMRAGLAALPDVPHVACFDTAFHATLPEATWRYPLPSGWVERLNIRRYGFHGLSVQWSTRRAAELLDRSPDDLRLIVAHLGSGCSVTAIEGGRSVDTSMGMTPYEGLMMGTRSGSIDPGIMLRLIDDGVEPGELADGLARRSGLVAMAGSASAREIEVRAIAGGDPAATLALDMFAGRAAAAIGAAATALPAVDALVFTGGIGEHSSTVRADITRRLGPIGIGECAGAATGDSMLTWGPPAVLVVEAREDRVIAEEVVRLMR